MPYNYSISKLRLDHTIEQFNELHKTHHIPPPGTTKKHNSAGRALQKTEAIPNPTPTYDHQHPQNPAKTSNKSTNPQTGSKQQDLRQVAILTLISNTYANQQHLRQTRSQTSAQASNNPQSSNTVKQQKITLINARNGRITGQLCSITTTSPGSSTEL